MPGGIPGVSQNPINDCLLGLATGLDGRCVGSDIVLTPDLSVIVRESSDRTTATACRCLLYFTFCLTWLILGIDPRGLWSRRTPIATFIILFVCRVRGSQRIILWLSLNGSDVADHQRGNQEACKHKWERYDTNEHRSASLPIRSGTPASCRWEMHTPENSGREYRKPAGRHQDRCRILHAAVKQLSVVLTENPHHDRAIVATKAKTVGKCNR